MAAHGRLTAGSPNALQPPQRPGQRPPRVLARRILQNQFPRHISTLDLAPEPRIFMLALSPEPPPPWFALPRHLPTKIWGECPPPPGLYQVFPTTLNAKINLSQHAYSKHQNYSSLKISYTCILDVIIHGQNNRKTKKLHVSKRGNYALKSLQLLYQKLVARDGLTVRMVTKCSQ